MMSQKENEFELPSYVVRAMVLTLISGMLCGAVFGFIRGLKYLSNGLLPAFFDTLVVSVNQAVLVVFLFLFLYTIVSQVVRLLIGPQDKWLSFVVGAISCLPFFLFFGYEIDRANKIYRSNFLSQEAIIFNLKVGIAFILLWLLISIGLFFWTRSMISNKSSFNMRGAGLLLGIFLVINLSMFLYHKLRPADSPNVVIILIDALRADELSSYGYSRKTSPNIDEFARDSVIFTQAISQSTFTKTSIASLITSSYPYQHGVYQGGKLDTKDNIVSDVLADQETTLAEVLLRDGFLNVAWVQQPQIASYLGFAQGYVEYNEQQGDIERINKEFLGWIDEIGKRHKFFAYIHYLDLHDPYRPKPPYDRLYGVYNADIYSGVDFGNWDFHRRQIKKRGKKEDIDQFRAYYDGQITYIDSQIGLLFENLKKAGLYDNSLIIVTSDHGDGFMEHGFLAHNTTPYEELIRVPLIIKFPDSHYAGMVVKSQVSLIDVMPTILDFLDLRTDYNMEGFSLMEYIRENDEERNKTNFPKYAYSEVGDVRGYHILSIRTERHKYILFQDNEEEFYDLSADPQEKNNIIGSRQNEAGNFRKIASYAVSERKKGETGKAVLDQKTIEELKALGYLGN